MLRRFVAGLLASACIFAPALAAAPTATGIPLTAQGQTYNEWSWTDGTHYFPGHFEFGWTGSAAQVWAMDTNGDGFVAPNCLVVSADQAFTVGSMQGCTMTATGRLKVGLSSAGILGSTAPTTGDLQAGIDPLGNQQGFHVDTSFSLYTHDLTNATNVGAPGASVCATDTGSSCNLNALLQRLAYDITLQNQAFQGAVTMTPGTAYAAQRSVKAICTVAGNVEFQFSDTSTITEPVQVGSQQYPYAVTQIVPGGTTATCTYSNLK